METGALVVSAERVISVSVCVVSGNPTVDCMFGQAVTHVQLAVEEERLLCTLDNCFLLLGKIVSGNINTRAA